MKGISGVEVKRIPPASCAGSAGWSKKFEESGEDRAHRERCERAAAAKRKARKRAEKAACPNCGEVAVESAQPAPEQPEPEPQRTPDGDTRTRLAAVVIRFPAPRCGAQIVQTAGESEMRCACVKCSPPSEAKS